MIIEQRTQALAQQMNNLHETAESVERKANLAKREARSTQLEIDLLDNLPEELWRQQYY